MDVVFVRHGEGEHMLDIPRSLEILHPRLTETGRAGPRIFHTRTDAPRFSATINAEDIRELYPEDASFARSLAPAAEGRYRSADKTNTESPCSIL
jgi:hypothetical protein